jgi:hypothetical protein
MQEKERNVRHDLVSTNALLKQKTFNAKLNGY